MDLRDFENRCKILSSIDMGELVDAGVISSDDTGAWQAFRAHPTHWLIRADDETSTRLWALVERRATAAAKAA
jgi:hypothetical protein